MNIIGEIKLFAGSYIPAGWLECNGNLLPIPVYKKLFSVIGHDFTAGTSSGGAGGPIYFALPNPGKPLIPNTKWIICVEGYYPAEDADDIVQNKKSADLMREGRKTSANVLDTNVKLFSDNVNFYKDGQYDNYDPFTDEFIG